MQDSRVQSLGQEDPLEEEMAIHPSVLAWSIPRTEQPGGLQSLVTIINARTVDAFLCACTGAHMRTRAHTHTHTHISMHTHMIYG